MSKSPIERKLEDLSVQGRREFIIRSWDRAVSRLDADAAGALTASRSLIEATCKYVLNMCGVSVPKDADINTLIKLVSEELLFYSHDMTASEKKFYGGIKQIVQYISELRNSHGDAHGSFGGGNLNSNINAELAVNASGSFCIFLVRKLNYHLALKRRITPDGDVYLKFDKTIVWRLVDHSVNSPKQMSYFGKDVKSPKLIFVADSGIYLMSNGTPRILINGKVDKVGKIGRNNLSLTAHAEGCDCFDDIEGWRPLQEAISGGDDFALLININDVKRALANSKTHIIMVCNADSYSFIADEEFDQLSTERH